MYACAITHLERALGHTLVFIDNILLSIFCHPVSMISLEDIAKCSLGTEEMNRDDEDMLPYLPSELVASSFQMNYL